MKSRAFFLWLLACLTFGSGVARAQDDTAQRVAQERSRITAERQAAEARYSQAEVACYQRFAVNDCINQAKAQRRQALADLRRQDITLNDEERRRRAADQRRRIDERSSPEKQQQAAQQRARALADAATRHERALNKQPAAPPAAAPADPAADPAASAPQQPASRPMPAQADPAAARKHQERLDAARERKERLEKRRQERTKPLAQPLPVPAS